MNIINLISIIFLTIGHLTNAALVEEISAAEYVKTLNEEVVRRMNRLKEASWAYSSNINPETDRIKNEAVADWEKFMKKVPTDVGKFNWTSFESEDLRRQFAYFSKFDKSAIGSYLDGYLGAVSRMESNYAKVKICDFNKRDKCDLSLEPQIEHIFARSRNPEELTYYWREFYDKAGTAVRGHFEKYIELNKKRAKSSNFTSGAAEWLSEYGDDKLEQKLENILREIRPLYQQIHGYVRHRLFQRYGESVVSRTGPIPMHILGNVWAEHWSEIADVVSPFPEKTINITNELINQGYTPVKMFQLGDDFFTSMNLTKLPQSFWEKSIFEKPSDSRELVCHSAAWDFYLNSDVRVKQCTRVTQEQFYNLHHELGHIQYFLQYQHLPYMYRNGANLAIHEAVGDVIALSVSTPKHLQRVRLLKNYTFDEEARVNRLLLTAIDKIVFIPFAYTIDKYRWALFRGQVPKNKWNCAFWKLREEYSGIEPPVKRSENDFDPPAKYHISADMEYLRYFLAFILQFQFYKTACIKAGQYDPQNPRLPLDNCDIYGSFEAGNSFKNILSLGSTKPWREVLEIFTGERTINASAVIEYFEPLRVWLEAENAKNNVHIGWTSSDKCSSS